MGKSRNKISASPFQYSSSIAPSQADTIVLSCSENNIESSSHGTESYLVAEGFQPSASGQPSRLTSPRARAMASPHSPPPLHLPPPPHRPLPRGFPPELRSEEHLRQTRCWSPAESSMQQDPDSKGHSKNGLAQGSSGYWNRGDSRASVQNRSVEVVGGSSETKDQASPWAQWQKDYHRRDLGISKCRAGGDEWHFETATSKNVIFSQTRERALQEGIVEATIVEGNLCIKRNLSSALHACSAEYWCRPCVEVVSKNDLDAHLGNERHNERVKALGDFTELLPWQEHTSDGRCIRCLLCKKSCNAFHEDTQDHKRKVEQWFQRQRTEFPTPQEAWLAFVGKEATGRSLKCLLCNKWVSDFTGLDTSSYNHGAHSRQSVRNCKEHRTKLCNFLSPKRSNMIWKEIVSERAIWHPPDDSHGKDEASKRNPWMPPPPTPPPPETSPSLGIGRLPDGWFRGRCLEYGQDYYYREGGPTQWTFPHCRI